MGIVNLIIQSIYKPCPIVSKKWCCYIVSPQASYYPNLRGPKRVKINSKTRLAQLLEAMDEVEKASK
jgi:hypothetical protein